MDYRSWMYQDSLEGLCMVNYCNRVEGFINYALSNPRNTNGGNIRHSCKRCKNKKFLDPDVITVHLLQKRVHLEILVLVCTQKTIYSL
jgi:hypothetical protein